MRGYDLLETIENLNPAYIENASRKPKSRKPSWQKWGAIAACLVLILSLGIWGIQRLPAGDSGMQGEYMADREPIIVTIKEIKDEGFICVVDEPDIHKFIAKDYEVLILFNDYVKIADSDFKYNSEAPNARDCGLEPGVQVRLFFDCVNYKADGMAHSLQATEIIPQ
ncbi:MAG: hypothetical protein IJ040_04955 [Lachnospiraceae bacterium]|nr:hypothetical protein [Lachnospiraceae bacterium]